MADELNIPTHRWYQPRYNISLPNSDFSKQWIFNSGIQKIDNWINGGSFSPSTLFALAEPGVWFDPSDLTTLFQDPAGTTPVTAPGSTVGLMLDKSRGLALGAELVTNGDFSNGSTGWTVSTVGDSTISVTGGVYSFSAPSGSTANLAQTVLSIGKMYLVQATVTAVTGAVRFYAGGSLRDITTTGDVRFYATATDTTFSVGRASVSSGSIDNISVRELAGNHATQATLAARPTYSIEPVGGRRNLLLQTEAFDTASWTKSNATASAGTITATASSGFHCVTQAATTSGSFVVASVRAKPGTSNFVWITATPSFGGANYATAVANLATGEVTKTQSGGTLTGATAAISGLDAQGFYRVTLSAANPTSVMTEVIGVSNSATPTITSYGSVEFAASGTESIITGGAQLELGSTATAYQRVTTQHDVTEAGVASVGYLYFNGVSNAMATSTITPGIDKAQVFAGVRKLSDANFSVIAEFTSDPATLPGSWTLIGSAATSGAYLFGGRGTTQLERRSDFLLAPRTNVLTGLYNIGGSTADEEVSARINGASAALTTYAGTSLGSGNYANAPLYLGARGGTAIPSNIHLYSLITRFGPTLDAPTIASTETWVAGKTGFYTPIITGVPTIGVS